VSILLLRYDQLKQDPANVRQRYDMISELAASIANHGLLQNIVVEADSLSDGFVVRAGNRRYLAIGMLIEQGKWDSLIPCLVHGDPLVQLVENIHREDVFPWSIGFRYLEVVDSGVTGKELAAALGKQYGHVSFHINLARCLHPEAIKLMEQYGAKLFTKKHLSDLCRFTDPVSMEPQKERQLEYIEKSVRVREYTKGVRPAGDRRVNVKTQIIYRLERLKKGEVKMDPGMEPFVRAVVDYLYGMTLNLRAPRGNQ